MDFSLWWVWMIVAGVFIIAEIFTAGFFLLWFGIGAVVAGIFAYLGLSIGIQGITFVVVSGVLFAASRRFAERVCRKQPPGIGADRFIGKRAVVLEEIDNVKNTGRIRLEEEDWRADSQTGEIIPAGKMVEVVKIEGTHLIVKVVKEGE